MTPETQCRDTQSPNADNSSEIVSLLKSATGMNTNGSFAVSPTSPFSTPDVASQPDPFSSQRGNGPIDCDAATNCGFLSAGKKLLFVIALAKQP